jgi:hypothetical protein
MSNVAPGAYVILAKTDVFANGTGSGIVQCRVNAGVDSDFANSLIGAGATPPESVFEASLEAKVVHQFAGSGTIDMDCTNNGPVGLTVTAQQTKIIAIKVGDITSNEPVSG